MADKPKLLNVEEFERFSEAQKIDYLKAQDELARQNLRKTLETAIRIGEAFRLMKRRLPHGKFRQFAENKCGIKPRTVTYYLDCEKRWTLAWKDGKAISDFRTAQELLNYSAVKTQSDKPEDTNSQSNVQGLCPEDSSQETAEITDVVDVPAGPTPDPAERVRNVTRKFVKQLDRSVKTRELAKVALQELQPSIIKFTDLAKDDQSTGKQY